MPVSYVLSYLQACISNSEHLLICHNLIADIMQNTHQDKNTSDTNAFLSRIITNVHSYLLQLLHDFDSVFCKAIQLWQSDIQF